MWTGRGRSVLSLSVSLSLTQILYVVEILEKVSKWRDKSAKI